MNPAHRLRRVRCSPALRRMTRECAVTIDDLVQPVFVEEGIDTPRKIHGLPGKYVHPLEGLEDHMAMLAERGVGSVMVFGVPSSKDPHVRSARRRGGIAQRAVSVIRECSEMLIMADACLCSYTDHGHCGMVKDGLVREGATLPILADMAETLADAGADVIAPSGMMDGAVSSIRRRLDDSGHEQVPIMSYAAKFNSALYGPFRDAACSSPQNGDRSSYQLDVANRREAMRSVQRDVSEGADIIMVKPAITSLDLIDRCRSLHGNPIAAYQVSGEYAMIKAAAEAGVMDADRVMMESLTAMKRAGADIIVTYYASEFLSVLEGEKV